MQVYQEFHFQEIQININWLHFNKNKSIEKFNFGTFQNQPKWEPNVLGRSYQFLAGIVSSFLDLKSCIKERSSMLLYL